MFLTGLSLTLSLWFSSLYFAPKIFGPDYLPAVSLIGILAFSILFRFLSTHLRYILSTRNCIWTNVKLTALTAFLNILLNLVLIPEYGAAGAAFATVLTYIALAICFVLATWPQLYLNRVFK
jgi:O-antigen/teichoic acid export membrane protein